MRTLRVFALNLINKLMQRMASYSKIIAEDELAIEREFGSLSRCPTTRCLSFIAGKATLV